MNIEKEHNHQYNDDIHDSDECSSNFEEDEIHEHNHNEHHHNHNISGVKGITLFWVILLNVVITAAEIIGGIFAGSLSLISDALHNFSDVVSVIISYFAIQITKRSNDLKRTFGYKRSEILAAIINSIILVVISLFLFREAYVKLMSPNEINGLVVVWVSLISLAANVISVLLLAKDTHSSMNVKSTYLHLLSDALSSVAVLVGGIAIYYFKTYWLDPVLTIIIGLYVIKECYEILKKATNILMQGAPEGFDIIKVADELKKNELIEGIHHVHCWSLSENEIHFEAHVNIKDIMVSETKKILDMIEDTLRTKYSIRHVTIQFENNCCGDTGIIKNCEV